MANFYDKVVDVTLTFGTAVLETAQFDIPLVISSHNVFPEALRIYTNSNALLQDGFSVDSPAYKMASLMFQGDASPDRVIIGRRTLDNFILNFEVLGGEIYSLTLKMGLLTKTFTYTSVTTSPTATQIVTALFDLIDADLDWSGRITPSVVGDTLVLTPVPEKYVDVQVTSNITVTRTTTEDILDTVANILGENNSWFWLASDSHIEDDVLPLASFAQANDKVYLTSTQDPDVKNKVADNLLEKLNLLGYRNTQMVLWSSDADTTFPEAALIGAMAAATPGTTTAHGKTLVGIPVERLDTTSEINIVSQNGNIYRREAGVNFYRDGRMVNGDFLDTVVHALWFKARVAESILALMKRQSDLLSGIRMNEEGFQKIKQAIWESPINIGINNGSILNEVVVSSETNKREDYRPTVTTPSRADIPTNDIAQRLLDNVVIEYVYAGFVHYVKVKVNVLIDR